MNTKENIYDLPLNDKGRAMTTTETVEQDLRSRFPGLPDDQYKALAKYCTDLAWKHYAGFVKLGLSIARKEGKR